MAVTSATAPSCVSSSMPCSLHGGSPPSLVPSVTALLLVVVAVSSLARGVGVPCSPVALVP